MSAKKAPAAKKEVAKTEVKEVAKEVAKAPETKAEEKPTKALVDAIAKQVTNPEGKVLFISKDKDCNAPILAGGVTYTPTYDESKSFLVWKVDAKNAAYFEQHTFVKFGKVIRALEK